MTEQELINKIIEQAKQARELLAGNEGFNIKRGMAHSISGYCEDIFALYIARRLQNPELQFFVDKIISTKFDPSKKTTSFKPDLAIVDQSNVLTHYFDLKTNLGWNRYLKEYLIKKNSFIENLISHNKAWITGKKEWSEFNLLNLTISQHLKYHMVIVFGGNINQKILEDNLKFAEELDFIELDILKPESSDFYDPAAFQSIDNSLETLFITPN